MSVMEISQNDVYSGNNFLGNFQPRPLSMDLFISLKDKQFDKNKHAHVFIHKQKYKWKQTSIIIRKKLKTYLQGQGIFY